MTDIDSSLCGLHGNGTRQRHDASYGLCPQGVPSLLCAWKKASDSELSHRGDRFHGQGVAYLDERSIGRSTFLDFCSSLDFPSGTCFIKNMKSHATYPLSSKTACACVYSRQSTRRGNRPEEAHDRRVQHRMRKPSGASRV